MDIKSITTEERTHISTKDAAFYLLRKPQTLRAWGCPSVNYKPPIKPIKIGNKLLWSVADIKKLLEIV